MGDVIFLAVILAFFGVATLLVQACDRIIGPDPDPDSDSDSDSDVSDSRAAGGVGRADKLESEGAPAW